MLVLQLKLILLLIHYIKKWTKLLSVVVTLLAATHLKEFNLISVFQSLFSTKLCFVKIFPAAGQEVTVHRCSKREVLTNFQLKYISLKVELSVMDKKSRLIPCPQISLLNFCNKSIYILKFECCDIGSCTTIRVSLWIRLWAGTQLVEFWWICVKLRCVFVLLYRFLWSELDCCSPLPWNRWTTPGIRQPYWNPQKDTTTEVHTHMHIQRLWWLAAAVA